MDLSVLLQLLHSLVISAGIGVPLIACAYVVMTPTHSLSASWQNFKMSRQPHRALKDRHFKGLPRKIRMWKVACFFLFFVFLGLALWQFHINPLSFLQHTDKAAPNSAPGPS